MCLVYLTFYMFSLSQFIQIKHLLKCLVDVVEFPGCIWKLLSEISSCEYFSQVQPFALDRQPLVQNVINDG